MPDEQNHAYEFDEFRVDVKKRQLMRGGEVVPLYSKAFDLLLVLIRSSGQDLSKDELLESVWPGQVLEEANLTVTMSVIRKALGERATRPRYIVTIPGHGYRFVADLNQSDGLIIEAESIAQVTIDQETLDDEIEIAPGQSVSRITEPADKHATDPQRLALPGETSKRSWRSLALFVVPVLSVGAVVAAFFIIRRIQHNRVASRFAQVKIIPITNIGRVNNVALSPDGKLFAFSRIEDDLDTMTLRLGQVNGDRDIELMSATQAIFRGLEFSRDGASIYYSAQDVGQALYKLYKIPALGGAPIKLREKIDQRFTLSPDETQVAFTRGNGESKTRSVLVSALDGTNEHAMLTLPSERLLQGSVSWSPDGANMAIAATPAPDKPNLTVLVAPVQGGAPKPITSVTWREITRLTWLKDGSGLLLIGAAPDLQEGRQVWFVNYPEGIAHRITDEPTIYDVGLSTGSDPNRFILVQQKQIYNLWLGPANDPGEAKQLTFTGPTIIPGAFAFDWLPDNRIVYAAPKGPGFNVSVMNSEGKEVKELTPAGTGDSVPAATADGRFIVFQSTRTGSDQIWRIDADGSNARQLTNCGENALPNVSSDGKWVVYISNCDGKNGLWRVTIDGEQPRRLSDRGVEWPWVSPDSKWVAAGYSEARKLKLAIYPIDGGAAVKVFDVAPKTIFHFGIRWTPDGKAIAYRDFWKGLWVQPIDGGEPQRIPRLPEGKIFSFGWSRNGKLFAFVRAMEYRDLVLISNAN